MSISFLIYMLSQLLVKGSVFFLAPIYTRMMSVQDYGNVSVFLSAVNIFAIFVGIQAHGSFNNAKIHFEKSEQKAYRSSIMTMCIICFIAFLILAYLFKESLSIVFKLPSHIVLLAAVSAFGSFCLQFQNAQSTADEKPLFFLLVSVSACIIDIVLSVIFVSSLSNDKYFGRILAILFTNTLFSVIIVFRTLFAGKTLLQKRYISFCLPLVMPLLFHALSGQVLSQCDLIMLNTMKGNDLAGIYSFGHTMGLPLTAIWTASNAVWIPFFYRHMKDKSFDELEKRKKNYYVTYTLLTIGYVLVCFEVFKILAPVEYQQGIMILPIVAISSYFTFIYSFPAGHEFYCGQTKMLSFATVMAAIINVILNFLLIPRLGIHGAAIATMLSYAFMALFHEITARYVVKGYAFSDKHHLYGLLAVLMSVAFSFLFMEIWLIRWSVAVIVGIMLIVRMFKNKSLF